MSLKSGHTRKFSRKKSKNWIFPGQKTFMDKKQNILEFSIFDKINEHEASKLSNCNVWIYFEASCTVFLSKIQNSKIFCVLSIKVF